MKKNDGYSLLQLLIALGVMGILVVISLSVGRSAIQKSSFSSGINQVVADFNYAKQLAAQQNRYVAFVFDPDGRKYRIMSQTTVGDLNNWTNVKDVEPLSGKEFFDGSSIPSFAVNSLGEVFDYPVASSVPATVNLTFFIKFDARGEVDYQKNIKIYPSGGIKIEQ